MKTKLLIITSFIAVMSSSAYGQVIRKCGGLHQPLDSYTQAIYRLFYGEGPVISTTTARAEVKFVNKKEVLEPVIEQLQKNGNYILRDTAAPGTVNVTVTDYMPVTHFQMDGGTFAVKVRFRKYFVREEGDVDGVHMAPIPKMQNISKIEYKIDHPNYKGISVNKQVLNIHDSDIPLMIKKATFFANRNALHARLNQLNPGQDALVRKFMEAFAARYQSEQGYLEGLFARTQYDRKSLQRILVSAQFPGQKMDAQITLDENIKLFDLTKGKVLRPYAPDVVVVENKTPIPLSGFTPENIQDTPALALVQKFVQFADQNHVEEYEKNAGKMSKIASKAEKRLRKAARALEDQQLQDIANDFN